MKCRDIHSDTVSPREIRTLWGLPNLHSRSRNSRLDETRCFLPLPGRKKFGSKNQV